MGSFTSVPALREDIQDADFDVGSHATRDSLLNRCIGELPSNPGLLTRNFVVFTNAKTRENKSENSSQDSISSKSNLNFDTFYMSQNGQSSPAGKDSASFRILTWNILAQGKITFF